MLVLAALVGYYEIIGLWFLLARDWMTEADERIVYFAGYTVLVVVASLLALLLEKRRQNLQVPTSIYYRIAIGSHTVGVVILTALSILSSDDSTIAVSAIALLGCAFAIAWVLPKRYVGRSAAKDQSGSTSIIIRIVSAVLLVIGVLVIDINSLLDTLPFIAIFILSFFINHYLVFFLAAFVSIALIGQWELTSSDKSLSLTFIGIAAAVIFLYPEKRRLLRLSWRLSPRLIDLLAVLLVLLLVPSLNFTYDRHHYNFYLGPINDVLHGKTLLVDANTQYGILNIYFPALIFRFFPLSYGAFSLINTIFYVAQHLVLYVTMRIATKKQFLSIMGLLLLITFYWNTPQTLVFPSNGAMRFLPLSILGLLILLRFRFPQRARLLKVAEAVTIGVASLWSLELGAMAWGLAVAVLLYELMNTHKTRIQFVRQAIVGIGLSTLYVLIPYALFTFVVVVTRGQMPVWERYLGYLSYYGDRNWFVTPFFKDWMIAAGIYFISLQFLFYKQLRQRTLAYIPLFVLTITGIAQLTYWMSNPTVILAHWNIAVAIGVVLIDWLIPQGYLPVFLRKGVYFLAASTAIFYLLAPQIPPAFILYTLPITKLAFPDDYMPPFIGFIGPDLYEAQARDLVERYAPDQERIAIFIAEESQTQLLIESDRVHLYPLSHPPLEFYNPLASQAALDFPFPLHANDVIFVDKNLDIRSHADIPKRIQLPLLDPICEQFSFEVLETTSLGIAALRLRADGQGKLCADFFGRLVVDLSDTPIASQAASMPPTEFHFHVELPLDNLAIPSGGSIEQVATLVGDDSMIRLQASLGYIAPWDGSPAADVTYRLTISGEDGTSIMEEGVITPTQGFLPLEIDISQFRNQSIHITYATETDSDDTTVGGSVLWLQPNIRGHSTRVVP